MHFLELASQNRLELAKLWNCFYRMDILGNNLQTNHMKELNMAFCEDCGERYHFPICILGFALRVGQTLDGVQDTYLQEESG